MGQRRRKVCVLVRTLAAVARILDFSVIAAVRTVVIVLWRIEVAELGIGVCSVSVLIAVAEPLLEEGSD
jgi:hypothetical protein